MSPATPDTPVILEAAINGMTSKEKNPHAPRSHDEIQRDALRCYELGATIVHAHNADIALAGREAADDYLTAWRPILDERPDALWYPTLTASPTMAERSGSLRPAGTKRHACINQRTGRKTTTNGSPKASHWEKPTLSPVRAETNPA